MSLSLSLYIYTKSPVNPIVRLSNSRSGDSQGKERILALSADKQAVTVTKTAQTTIPPYQP